MKKIFKHEIQVKVTEDLVYVSSQLEVCSWAEVLWSCISKGDEYSHFHGQLIEVAASILDLYLKYPKYNDLWKGFPFLE